MTDNVNGTETQENAPKWYHDPDTGAFYDLEDNELGFYFHPKDMLFITSNDWKIKFRDFNQQSLIDMQQTYERKHKPKVPQKPYDIGDGDVSWESHPDDPAYKEALETYWIEIGLIIQSLQLSFGLDFKVPPEDTWDEEFADMVSISFDEDTPFKKHQLKRKYLEWQLTKKHEYTVLVQLVQGKTMPTVDEVKKETDRFPSKN
jgi:hypothetical protein